MKRLTAVFVSWLGAMAFVMTPAGAVTLGNAVRAGNQLQFTVTGDSNAAYFIEGATNLQQWRSVLTNREFGVTRTVAMNVSDAQSYYRARVARAFAGAIAARGQINLQGNDIRIDSFDSSNLLYSTPDGRYDPSTASDGADVATSSGLTNSLSVGNAEIYGKISTGPGGNASIGPSGCVGSVAYVSNPLNAGKIQPGWFREDATPFFPDPRLPSLSPSFTPSWGLVGGTNYTYVLGSENYRVPSLTMSNGTMMVTGRATFWVQDDINIGGTARVVVAPTGSLILYVGMPSGTGATATIAGNGIVNQTGRALGFQYYGLRSNTSVTLSVHDLIGTIYAPNAALTLSSGGSMTYDFSGAAVARTVTVNGHYNVHYDEALAQAGPLF